jgi:hypothetical protein
LRFVATPRSNPAERVESFGKPFIDYGPVLLSLLVSLGLRKDLCLVPQYAMDKDFLPGRADILKLVYAHDIEQAALGFSFSGDLDGKTYFT